MSIFRLPRMFAAAAALALLFSGGGTRVQAHDSASPAPVDCTRSSAMMDQGMKAAPPAMTGVIDNDTMALMQMHARMTMEMAKMEMACGKDAKKKAAAEQLLNETTKLVEDITRLRTTYQY